MRNNFLLFSICVEIIETILDGSSAHIFNYILNLTDLKPFLPELLRGEITETILDSRSTRINLPKEINLQPILENLSLDHCLIVLNNFESVDLVRGSFAPIILRQFDFTLLSRKPDNPHAPNGKYEFKSFTWIPKQYFKDIIGSYNISINHFEDADQLMHNCPHSKHFAPIPITDQGSDALCVDLDLVQLSVSSKSWQCQVQLDIFMPQNLLQIARYTQIFGIMSPGNYNLLPILRPTINILVDSKRSPKKYRSLDLLMWSTRDTNYFYPQTTYKAMTDILFTGHMNCKKGSYKAVKMYSCNVKYV